MSGQSILIFLDCDFKRCGNRTQLLALALELADLANKGDDPLQSCEDKGCDSCDRPRIHRVEDQALRLWKERQLIIKNTKKAYVVMSIAQNIRASYPILAYHN
jgi:hypothetical protein